MNQKRKWWFLIGSLIVIFVILDFGYVWANLKFLFYKPQPVNFTREIGGQISKNIPDFLTIESLNISAPVIYATATAESAVQESLRHGVVHYPGTVLPGQAGNCYLFGHSSDFVWSQGQYKSVFAVLPKIKLGARIGLSDNWGREFVYTVIDSRMVAANDLSVLGQQNYQKKMLTLQTSYPVGTALARWVVVAQLQE